MASASECMHMPGTPNTIIQELHPMALLYILRGVRSHAPHQLVHGGSWLSDKIERRLFWGHVAMSSYLLIMKRSSVLAATIQLSPSARAS